MVSAMDAMSKLLEIYSLLTKGILLQSIVVILLELMVSCSILGKLLPLNSATLVVSMLKPQMQHIERLLKLVMFEP